MKKNAAKLLILALSASMTVSAAVPAFADEAQVLAEQTQTEAALPDDASVEDATDDQEEVNAADNLEEADADDIPDAADAADVLKSTDADDIVIKGEAINVNTADTSSEAEVEIGAEFEEVSETVEDAVAEEAVTAEDTSLNEASPEESVAEETITVEAEKATEETAVPAEEENPETSLLNLDDSRTWKWSNVAGGVEIEEYYGTEKNVKIPAKLNGYNVVQIGSEAFQNTAIESVIIPEGIRSIGYQAFAGCESLKNLTLPTTLKSIDGYAFQNTAIKTVTIPAKVSDCGSSVFDNCSDLTEVTFASGMTAVPSGVLNGTSSVTKINIPDTVTSIGSNAFYGTGISSIRLPSNLKEIGYEAFAYCESLSTLTLPASLKSIAGYAFSGCDKLKKVIFNGSSSAWNQVSGRDQLSHCNIIFNKKDLGSLKLSTTEKAYTGKQERKYYPC